jgi:septum site-determining protein MinC
VAEKLGAAATVSSISRTIVRMDGPTPVIVIPEDLRFDELKDWIRERLPTSMDLIGGRTSRLDFGAREIQLIDLRRLVHLLRDEFAVDITGLYVRNEAILRYAERELKLKLFPLDPAGALQGSLQGRGSVVPAGASVPASGPGAALTTAPGAAAAPVGLLLPNGAYATPRTPMPLGAAARESVATPSGPAEAQAKPSVEPKADRADPKTDRADRSEADEVTDGGRAVSLPGIQDLAAMLQAEPAAAAPEAPLATPSSADGAGAFEPSDAVRREPSATPQRDAEDEADGATKTLSIRRTLRSGAAIHFDGDVIVIGDVNAGAQIRAGGNIIVLGKLRGVVHAGARGDDAAFILAFELAPTQLRISKQIAIAPARAGNDDALRPEIATVADGAIVIEPWRGARRR